MTYSVWTGITQKSWELDYYKIWLERLLFFKHHIIIWNLKLLAFIFVKCIEEKPSVKKFKSARDKIK
jgi:hypothetical protein